MRRFADDYTTRQSPHPRGRARHGTVDEAEVNAIREAGYTERQVVEIALAITSITFTNLVNRVNDTTLDFPAVA